jgi:hypothetical protein
MVAIRFASAGAQIAGEQMAKRVACPANQWTVLFDHAFVQIPRDWNVSFTAADGSVVAGEVQEQRSSWIFPNPPIIIPLESDMVFHRGWWNTFYRVRIKPTQDVIAQIG